MALKQTKPLKLKKDLGKTKIKKFILKIKIEILSRKSSRDYTEVENTSARTSGSLEKE